MFKDLETFMDDLAAEKLAILLFFTVWAGIIRTVIITKSRNLTAYLVSISISIPAGTLASLIAQEYDLGYFVSVGIAVFVGIVAHDVINTIISVTTDKKLINSVIQSQVKKITKSDEN